MEIAWKPKLNPGPKKQALGVSWESFSRLLELGEALGSLLEASWSLLGVIWELWKAPRQQFG